MWFRFPTSQPAATVAVQLAPGTLGDVPTWSIQTLNVGPSRGSTTVGSCYDWSDELRFDVRSGKLVSFILKMPESGLVATEVARTWLALPAIAALPVLEDRDTAFHVDPLDLRWFAPEGTALVVTDATLPAPNAASVRLALGGDVDLLFHDGSYRGWILSQPIVHLVARPEDKPPMVDEPRVHAVVADYLALVIGANIDRMSDEDPEVLAALRTLRDRARGIDASQARALAAEIGRVIDTFYPTG